MPRNTAKITTGTAAILATFIAAHIMLRHGYGYGVLLALAGICAGIAQYLDT